MKITINDVDYECKIIPSFNNYAATKSGEIITLRYKGHKGVRRLLRPSATEKGYMAVNLRKDGKLYRKKVHRLVWEAFNGTIDSKLEINHKDENKCNNSLCNLELVTHVDNINYGTHNTRAAATKRMRARRRGDAANAVAVKLKVGDDVLTFSSIVEAIEFTKVSKRQFYICLKQGVIKKYGKIIATVVTEKQQ